ncbi:MAG: heme o synthase [Flavobacteriaceae bacterium]|jgi:protoheme IX farnesyltransferase|nr:heme o synthase [Flavobacteriaceae bacterium]
MIHYTSIQRKITHVSIAKFSDYLQLVKVRLTLSVTFSAGVGYVLGADSSINFILLGILLLGGFLITGAANGLNQIFEKDLDKLMIRTTNRPVASGRLTVIEAYTVSLILGIVGVFLLNYFFNFLSSMIGVLSLAIYAFIYTPLKQKSRLAVVAGAIAGAAPPVIGYIAITGTIDVWCVLLFTLQFLWQFPHFWAIAWMLDDDYKKAGFRLLPSLKGRTKWSAIITFLSTSLIIPLVLFFYLENYVGLTIGFLILLLTIHFTYQSYLLYQTQKMESAKKLMFGSFYYLPLVQILLMISKYL